MGSDDLFHKRKARDAAALKRNSVLRAQNRRYLIVCEGTKTEPQYFRELLDDLRIRPHVVRIEPNDGPSPDRVVDHALHLYNEDAGGGDAYDMVYCVFDRDSHTTFKAAVQRTKDLTASGQPLTAITSTPCFEFWLLLHFGYTAQPFHKAGKRSVGDQAVAALKNQTDFANYGKGQKGIYAKLKGRLPAAITNAGKLRAHNIATRTDNPSTDVDRLISDIRAVAPS